MPTRASLERLRRDVRRALDGDVRRPELRDGAVAVPDEDAVVERARAPEGLAVVRRRASEEAFREALLADELVEEDAPQALRRPAVAREESAGHLLRGSLRPNTGASTFVKKRCRIPASSRVNSDVMFPRS